MATWSGKGQGWALQGTLGQVTGNQSSRRGRLGTPNIKRKVRKAMLKIGWIGDGARQNGMEALFLEAMTDTWSVPLIVTGTHGHWGNEGHRYESSTSKRNWWCIFYDFKVVLGAEGLWWGMGHTLCSQRLVKGAGGVHSKNIWIRNWQNRWEKNKNPKHNTMMATDFKPPFILIKIIR